jgi:acetate kinase
VVAHRIVHGGARTSATLVDDAERAELERLVELAPLHQPPALHSLDAARAAWPSVPQVACFDTAFHTTIPAAARTYALPERLRALVRSYGFHGLSHAWSVARAAELVPGSRRVVVAHLGGGASVCAALDGRSVWTSMGFTPLDGLVMATRSGSVDPGAVLWLAEHTDEDLSAVLESESGLLGLTGTADMRKVLARVDAGDLAAVEGLAVYVHRLVAMVGSSVAVLGGLDAIVFTGGVGENAARVRRDVVDRLGWLGARVGDHAVTPGVDVDISAAGSRVRALVVHAREDLMMAALCRQLLDRA